MPMRDASNEKQHKPAYQRKNPRSAEQQAEERQAKNARRPKQRWLGLDSETGFGLGWTR